MASPFNPFGAGRGQRGGTATGAATTGRGRGTPAGRGSQFQPGGGSAFRTTKYRGRGRGLVPQVFRGRGAGAPARGDASHLEVPTGGNSNKEVRNLPPVQPNQKKSFSAIFGSRQGAEAKPSFFGTSDGSVVETFHKSGQSLSEKLSVAEDLPNGSSGWPRQPVPVENASTLARYSERYEQVSNSRPSVLAHRYHRRTIYLTYFTAQNRPCAAEGKGYRKWPNG